MPKFYTSEFKRYVVYRTDTLDTTGFVSGYSFDQSTGDITNLEYTHIHPKALMFGKSLLNKICNFLNSKNGNYHVFEW